MRTRERQNRPFYLHPPWNILFDPQMLERINPWEINLSFLLLSFLEEMEKRAVVDFRASGIALDSSATVYLMKSQLLLKLEEPPQPVQKPDSEYVPPPLILPLRYELTTTTIQNLLEALEDALKSERIFKVKISTRAELPLFPREAVSQVNIYLMEMEKQMRMLMRKIRSLIEAGEIVTFSKLVEGMKRLDQIRNFIVLLFLAHRDKVSLWQREGSDEIFITPGEGLLNGGLR
ncbi:MAG: condensin subunit ScpA [Candidatus Bathyarchaeota archaeon B63]|nr:MAG: condensin subunit ScpA [Candidatus Bathyarchaeota archaeon B63]